MKSDQDELFKELDELALRPGLNRKTSIEKTLKCPIYDPFTGFYMESDEQLRKRLEDWVKNA